MIKFTQDERLIYDRVYEFCCEHYSATVGNWAAQFPLVMLQRQTASTIPGMLRHYFVLLKDRQQLEAEIDAGENIKDRVFSRLYNRVRL